MKALLRHARELGVSVHTAHLPRPYRGIYDIVGRRVIYDFSLTQDEARSVVAHELGHVYYCHSCEGDPRAEALADAYAASLLVDPEQYAMVAKLYPDAHTLAEELGVEEDIIHAFNRSHLQRIGSTTYARTHAGTKRWEEAWP